MTDRQKKMLARIIVSAIFFILGLIFPYAQLKIAIFLIAYLIAGYDIIIKAAKNIAHLQIFDENFLMLIASAGAFFLKEYPEAVAIALFYQIGELFQSYAVGKSRKSIRDLMKIKPDLAHIEINGGVLTLDPQAVELGDTIIIHPGEKIPVDGIVTQGTALIDTTAMTGESVPQAAEVGSRVTSGCICTNGMIKIKSTSEFAQSTVSKVLKLVTEASEKKTKYENFITKFSKYYTPVVVTAAAIMGILIPLFFPVDTAVWVKKALVFLVVSCPCALIISVPLSFFGGIGSASKNGILIKGSHYIEALSKAGVAVFDKTGTITKGEYSVAKICPKSSEISTDELLKTAAIAEMHSSHPVAVSLRKACGSLSDAPEISDCKEIAGKGVTVKINDDSVSVGNERLMTEINADFDKVNDYGTVIHVAKNKKYMGYILITDQIKGNAREAVRFLKEEGVTKTAMLSGDKKEIVEYVGNSVGIDEIHSELLPQDKVKYVEKLKNETKKGASLLFVGDGINDAPSLAFADVGIAMGAIGSDAAIEAADVVIMDDNPEKISEAIALSKSTMKIAYENIAFSLGVKFFFLITGALGLSGLWGAVFADVGVTIIAILNAFRTMKKPEEKKEIEDIGALLGRK